MYIACRMRLRVIYNNKKQFLCIGIPAGRLFLVGTLSEYECMNAGYDSIATGSTDYWVRYETPWYQLLSSSCLLCEDSGESSVGEADEAVEGACSGDAASAAESPADEDGPGVVGSAVGGGRVAESLSSIATARLSCNAFSASHILDAATSLGSSRPFRRRSRRLGTFVYNDAHINEYKERPRLGTRTHTHRLSLSPRSPRGDCLREAGRRRPPDVVVGAAHSLHVHIHIHVCVHVRVRERVEVRRVDVLLALDALVRAKVELEDAHLCLERGPPPLQDHAARPIALPDRVRHRPWRAICQRTASGEEGRGDLHPPVREPTASLPLTCSRPR